MMLSDENNEEAKFEVLNFLFEHLNISSNKHQFINGLIHHQSKLIFKELEAYQIVYDAKKFDEYSIFEKVEDISDLTVSTAALEDAFEELNQQININSIAA